MPKPKLAINPRHPERICWGCDKYCSADDLAAATERFVPGTRWNSSEKIGSNGDSTMKLLLRPRTFIRMTSKAER